MASITANPTMALRVSRGIDEPANTANAVLPALRPPVGSEIREMLVMASGESSWP